jgi:hypothetical protein
MPTKSTASRARTTVVTLVLGVDKGLEEGWIDLIKLHRRAVLVEVFANELALGTVDLGGLRGLGVHDAREIAGTLAEEPEQLMSTAPR